VEGDALSQTLYISIGVLIFLFGLVVLREAPRQRLNIITALMLFLAGLGSVLAASGKMYQGDGLGRQVSHAPFVESFAYLWEFFFPALLLFSLLFPREKGILKKVPLFGLLIFVPHVFHLLLLLWVSIAGVDLGLPELAKRAEWFAPAVSASEALVRLAYYGHRQLFSLVNLAYAFSSCVLMAQSFREFKIPQLRNQMKVIFLGMGVCLGLYSIAVPIPTLLRLSAPEGFLVPTVVAALIVGSGSVAFAVVRYRFLDLGLIARRGILYAGVSAVMVGLYLVVVRQIADLASRFFGVETRVLDAVFLVVAVILFQPVISALEGVLDSLLVGDRRDYRNLLRSLSSDVITILDQDKLAGRIVDGLAQSVMIENAALLTRRQDNGDYLSVYRSFGIAGLHDGDPVMPCTQALAEVPAADLMSKVEFLGALDEDSREVVSGTLDRMRVHMIAVLRHGTDVLGALTLGQKITGTRYTAEDRALLSSLASQLTSALKNAALYRESVERSKLEEEMVLARQIQRSFLPARFPRADSFDIYGSAIPSKHVGGDYFDVLDLGGGRFMLAVADVAGKGVPAGLLMSMLQASLRTQVSENGIAVGRILQRINRLVFESTGPEQFATFFLCTIDSQGPALTFSNAGHNYPIVVRGDGSYELLQEGGLILGIMRDVTFNEGSVSMRSGDMLVCYTDGVTEARNALDEEYGEERLLKLLRSVRCSVSAAEVIEVVHSSVTEFTGGAEPADDMTMLVLRIR
jgi:sigma-B regulation protein RsbU (phosphoserine phosphatase)